MSDVTMIVDQHKRYSDAREHGRQVDAEREAPALNQLVNVFGSRGDRFALVSKEDQVGLNAYNKAGFKTIPVNGNRSGKIHEFITETKKQLQSNPPRQLVLVSDDPMFQFMLDENLQAQGTQFAVWVPGSEIPEAYKQPHYNVRKLEDLLPGRARVDVRLDFENLYIGLRKRGHQMTAKDIIDLVKRRIQDLGEPNTIVAYADWDALSRDTDRNLQRELALAGVETRYQVNMNGKNSADMKIADDIRTLVEREAGTPEAVDIIVLATNDRDFRPSVETAQQRGQRIVLLGFRDGLSWELREKAKEIRFLDDFLKTPNGPPPNDGARPTSPLHPNDPHAALTVRIAAWLLRRNYAWTYRDRLINGLELDAGEQALLQSAIDRGILTSRLRGESETLSLSREHPIAQMAYHLVRWVPHRIRECLERGMPYVDSYYLANGMLRSRNFQELGVQGRWYHVAKWLNLTEEAGVVERRKQRHPKDEKKQITTWWLPGTRPEPEEPVKPVKPTKPGVTTSPEEPPAPEGPAPLPPAPDRIAKQKAELRDKLANHFSLGELKDLCQDLQVEHENVPGERRIDKARELVDYMRRRGRLAELIAACKERRPHVNWEPAPKPEPEPSPRPALPKPVPATAVPAALHAPKQLPAAVAA